MCVRAGACVPRHSCGGQRTAFQSLFTPFHCRFHGSNSARQACSASAFTYRAISLVQDSPLSVSTPPHKRVLYCTWPRKWFPNSKYGLLGMGIAFHDHKI